MNFYCYHVRIFDTDPNADTNFWPRVLPYTAIAPDPEEAQREIVDQIYDPETGVVGMHLREDDPSDRYTVCFDDPEIVRPVEWNDEIGEWIWADEPVDVQVAARRLTAAFASKND